MHPALSIIFFTAASGIGYGIAFVLGLGALDLTSFAGRAGYALALVLIGTGLLSSTLHLGHPERSWRALSQWRSSWLSREGVLAVLAMIPLGLAGLGSVIFGEHWTLPAIIGAAIALPVVYSTAMIYASLKTIHQWATPLTALCYLGFALGGGALCAYALASFENKPIGGLPLAALILVELAWIIKAFWWRRADNDPGPSTPESATGLGAWGEVRLLERPHVTENYLTKEMGHRVARKHAKVLRKIAILLGAIVPLVIILIAQLGFGSGNLWTIKASYMAHIGGPLAFCAFFAGVLLERWLFFAEAKHTVMLYYGKR